MPEYGFCLTRLFLYKDRIYDSTLYGKIRVKDNPFSDIFCAMSDVHNLPLQAAKRSDYT